MQRNAQAMKAQAEEVVKTATKEVEAAKRAELKWQIGR